MKRLIRHSGTGKQFIVEDDPLERTLYGIKRKCRALDRKAREHNLQIYFLTLTLRRDQLEVYIRVLNGFLNFLRARFRRAGMLFFYVWVLELQEKRYRKYGEKALHWHVAIAVPWGSLPDCKFDKDAPRYHKFQILREGELITVRDLYDRWGKGNIFCMEAYSSGVYGYLSKYITKEYETLKGWNTAWASLRRFGSSSMGHYCFPEWGYDTIEELKAKEDPLADMYFRKEGSRINFYGREEVVRPDGKVGWQYVRVTHIRSPYQTIAMGDSLSLCDIAAPSLDKEVAYAESLGLGENDVGVSLLVGEASPVNGSDDDTVSM